MIKIFDYEEGDKWEEFPSLEFAEIAIIRRFDQYWLQDRDNCHDYHIEIDIDGERKVWCLEAGAWYGCGDEDGPYKNVYFGKKEDFSVRWTTLKPRVDYILVSRYLT